ncbi:MAG: redox-regulated ATPase YchF [Chlamydiia bacterium]
MNLKVGIVGLPNVGKSTLYSAITRIRAEIANYPFCTIEPNEALVELPDERLHVLEKLSASQRRIHATITFVDIAGLVKGASEGQGLGNKFLTNIRDCDMILHCVRCFDSQDIIHVEGRVSPKDDAEIINLELILSDLDSLQSILPKVEKIVRSNKEKEPTLLTLRKMLHHLESSLPLRSLKLTADEQKSVKEYTFLTSKPVLYVGNVSEDDLQNPNNPYVKALEEIAKSENAACLTISAKLEEELSQLSGEEAKDFLEMCGLTESGLNRIIRKSFDLLGLATYFTVGEMEARAWTIRKGTLAPQAAGEIHSDLENKFIRAEVIGYDDFVACASRAAAKEKGVARTEGKSYVVKDGDVILFFHG